MRHSSGCVAAPRPRASISFNCMEETRRAGWRGRLLLAQAQPFHNLAIPVRVSAVQIIQQAPSPVDHHDQPAPRRMVLRMCFQMGCQVVDALAQQRDLHLRRSRISRVRPELLDHFCFEFHQLSPPSLKRQPVLALYPLPLFDVQNASTRLIPCQQKILLFRPAGILPRASHTMFPVVCSSISCKK